MVNFDEYRKRWVYKCQQCGEIVTVFRDCGQQTPCRCGGTKSLVDTIEPSHIENSPDISISVHTFKPYFDVTLGKEVTSKKEIQEYCKRNDCVYAGDKELTQQCKQNKAENEKRFNDNFEKSLKQQLMERLS